MTGHSPGNAAKARSQARRNNLMGDTIMKYAVYHMLNEYSDVITADTPFKAFMSIERSVDLGCVYLVDENGNYFTIQSNGEVSKIQNAE